MYFSSAHVTSCSYECRRSLFGKRSLLAVLFPVRPRNCLALEWVKKLSYIHSNSNSGVTGADEEAALSLADIVIEDKQEANG